MSKVLDRICKVLFFICMEATIFGFPIYCEFFSEDISLAIFCLIWSSFFIAMMVICYMILDNFWGDIDMSAKDVKELTKERPFKYVYFGCIPIKIYLD